MEKRTFEWVVRWHGCNDNEMFRAAAKAATTFHIWKDAEAKLVDHSEYAQMVTDGLIDPEYSYGANKPGTICVVSLGGYYSGYQSTWDLTSTMRVDFENGWNACEAKYKLLSDWDEAIAHEKARKDWKKVMKRKFTIDLTGEYNVYYHSVERLSQSIDGILKSTLYTNRNGKAHVVIECKCNGNNMWHIMKQIGNSTGWWNHQVPASPYSKENK